LKAPASVSQSACLDLAGGCTGKTEKRSPLGESDIDPAKDRFQHVPQQRLLQYAIAILPGWGAVRSNAAGLRINRISAL
jgi:hypothetical protein